MTPLIFDQGCEPGNRLTDIEMRRYKTNRKENKNSEKKTKKTRKITLRGGILPRLTD